MSTRVVIMFQNFNISPPRENSIFISTSWGFHNSFQFPYSLLPSWIPYLIVRRNPNLTAQVQLYSSTLSPSNSSPIQMQQYIFKFSISIFAYHNPSQSSELRCTCELSPPRHHFPVALSGIAKSRFLLQRFLCMRKSRNVGPRTLYDL